MRAKTHVIRAYEGVHQVMPGIDQKYKVEDLYRADGMMVATRQDDLIRFGSDISTAQNRPFMDEFSASQFLRRIADVDIVCQEEGRPLHEVIDRYATLPHGLASIEFQDGSQKDITRADGSAGKIHLPGRPRLH